jgi:hypothetical protein
MDQVLFLHTEAELIRAARAGDGSAFALIGMDAALSTGDQASYNSRRTSLQQALASVDADATIALNG